MKIKDIFGKTPPNGWGNLIRRPEDLQIEELLPFSGPQVSVEDDFELGKGHMIVVSFKEKGESHVSLFDSKGNLLDDTRLAPDEQALSNISRWKPTFAEEARRSRKISIAVRAAYEMSLHPPDPVPEPTPEPAEDDEILYPFG